MKSIFMFVVRIFITSLAVSVFTSSAPLGVQAAPPPTRSVNVGNLMIVTESSSKVAENLEIGRFGVDWMAIPNRPGVDVLIIGAISNVHYDNERSLVVVERFGHDTDVYSVKLVERMIVVSPPHGRDWVLQFDPNDILNIGISDRFSSRNSWGTLLRFRAGQWEIGLLYNVE